MSKGFEPCPRCGQDRWHNMDEHSMGRCQLRPAVPGDWQRSGHRGQVLHCVRAPAWAVPGWGTSYCGIPLWSGEPPASEGRRCARCQRRQGRWQQQQGDGRVFAEMKREALRRAGETASTVIAAFGLNLPFADPIFSVPPSVFGYLPAPPSVQQWSLVKNPHLDEYFRADGGWRASMQQSVASGLVIRRTGSLPYGHALYWVAGEPAARLVSR